MDLCAFGKGGIRTHDTVTRIHAFEARSFSRSDTFPKRVYRNEFKSWEYDKEPRARLAGAEAAKLKKLSDAGGLKCLARRRSQKPTFEFVSVYIIMKKTLKN